MSLSAPMTIQKPEKVTRKARLGFLGLGWIGRLRLASIAQAGCAEVCAVADLSSDCLDQALEHAPDAVRAGSLEELIDLDLDGIVIATPSAMHAGQAIAALERGMAVFCQKPLGRNGAETVAVIDRARDADLLLGVDLSYRHTAAMQAVRQSVRSGELGEIFAVDLVFHNAYGPQAPWFYDPCQSGGGCVLDLGIHLVDAALWVLESPVVDVHSRLFHAGRRLRSREQTAEDYAVVWLDLASEAVVELQCSWRLHAGCDAIIEAVFRGTEGSAALRNVAGSFFDFRAERHSGTATEILSEPPDDWGGRAAVEWARQLAGGSGYHPEIERLNDVARALDLIYERAGHN